MVIGWTAEFYEIMVWIMVAIAIAMITVVMIWVRQAAKLEEQIHPQIHDRDELLNRIL